MKTSLIVKQINRTLSLLPSSSSSSSSSRTRTRTRLPRNRRTTINPISNFNIRSHQTTPEDQSTTTVDYRHFESDVEDQQIKTAFDHQHNQNTRRTINQSINGLFGYDQIQTAEDLLKVSRRTIRRSELIVERICNHQSKHSDPRDLFLKIVGMFDRLSDGLCRVIDLSELIRNVHPDPDWLMAAHQSHDLLCRYMNTLNTHLELYNSLHSAFHRLPSHIINHPDLFPAKTVALQFIRDFQRHGIHLPTEERKKLVQLSDRMLVLGRAFFDQSTQSNTLTTITKQEAIRLGTGFSDLLHYDHHHKTIIDPNSWEAHSILSQHPDEQLRRRIWIDQNTSTDEQVDILDTLLQTRFEFARMTGKSSWAEVALEDKMAGSPKNVMSFLTRLSQQIRPLALGEIKELQKLKQHHLTDHPTPFYPWDRDYYLNLATRAQKSSIGSIDLSEYFSVGTCLQGLSRLFTTIYGISFRVETCGRSEIWHDSVVKLGVLDEREGRIGTIYCDLFDRPGKSRGAAHYTVLCSRRTDGDDQERDFEFLKHRPEPIIDDIYQSEEGCELLKVPDSKRIDKEGRYQRPIVVFSCSFDPPDPDLKKPGLLSWSDLETLFHEMGHAMHSMIGQTDYHNVSGTRCATDLVELPSTFMEQFLTSTQALKLFSLKHYLNPSKKITKNLNQIIKIKNFKRFKNLEIQYQIFLSILDQSFHSEFLNNQKINSTDLYHLINQQFNLFPMNCDNNNGLLSKNKLIRPQTKFSHLNGYNSTYYSYLLDKIISKKIYNLNFKKTTYHHHNNNEDEEEEGGEGVLSRLNGQRFKDEILKWGGCRDGFVGIGILLNDFEISNGGSAAFIKLSHWSFH